MTVLYRAQWADRADGDEATFLDLVRAGFSAWALGETGKPALQDGYTELTLPDGRERRITVAAFTTADGSDFGPVTAFEGTVTDDDKNGIATRWTTVVRVACSAVARHTWVQLSVESDDLNLRVKVGGPRVVDDLLALANKPCQGRSVLLMEPLELHSGEVPVLVDILGEPERALPYIVCTEPPGSDDGRWRKRASTLARRTRGVAVVVALDAAATTAFRNSVGDLALWGGGLRVYMPGAALDPAEAWRHRYYTRLILEERQASTLDRVVYSITQLSARRRSDDIFEVFEAHPGVGSAASPATEFTSEELERGARMLEYDLQRLSLEERITELLIEQEQAQHDINAGRGHLERLRVALEQQGLGAIYWGTQYDPGNDVPDDVNDVEEAIDAAELYLSTFLVVHSSAAQELDGILSAPNASAWGNTAWRGFRALAAYAESRKAGFPGDFWAWCASGPPLGWPATSKKLSMTESESVLSNKKWKEARCLPVSDQVADGGRTYMFSHLKVAEGGGDLAPRIYFYDDTSGATGKIHIGFVGPHYLMPNTKS